MGETATGPLACKVLHASFVVDDLDGSSAFLSGLFGFRASFGPVDLGDAFARLSGHGGAARLVQLGREGAPETVELIEVRGAPTTAFPSAHLSLSVSGLDNALAAATGAGAASMGEAATFSEGRAAYVRAPGGLVIELEELFE